MLNLHKETEQPKLKFYIQSHSLLALDRKIKNSFNFAMSPVGDLDFWLIFIPLSVMSDPSELWKTETTLCFQFRALIFWLDVVQNVFICPTLSPFFLLSLLLCGCRTTRSGGLPSSWRCRTRARTCWLQTARLRWRTGSTHSTRSCTAASRSPCRRRGTETFTTVCAYTAPVGTQELVSISHQITMFW